MKDTKEGLHTLNFLEIQKVFFFFENKYFSDSKKVPLK